MNLEAIMEWVDIFSLLKKQKNKFEIVCIWLRIFMNSSPCFLISYFTQCVCVWYRINLYGKGWREEEAVKGLGIHQVPGILVVLSLGVPCPQACLLWSEGNPSCYSEGVFGERALHANTEGSTSRLFWFPFYPPLSPEQKVQHQRFHGLGAVGKRDN